jgi:thiol-disulfide isomerase/thioredoxin
MRLRSFAFAALLAWSAAAGGGCSSGGIPADAKTTVLSFTNLDCSDCGNEMARDLVAAEGVHKTAFDSRRAELTVVADPGVDVFALAQSKKPPAEEWSLVVGVGKGSYKPWATPKPGVDVVEITTDGQDVPELAPHLAKGKITIVDFSAKWCEPCRELDAVVLDLLEQRPELAYRKLDIGDWDTPLAKRYLAGVKELPFVIVYDRAGREVARLSGMDRPKLDAAVAQAAGAP